MVVTWVKIHTGEEIVGNLVAAEGFYCDTTAIRSFLLFDACFEPWVFLLDRKYQHGPELGRRAFQSLLGDIRALVEAGAWGW